MTSTEYHVERIAKDVERANDSSSPYTFYGFHAKLKDGEIAEDNLIVMEEIREKLASSGYTASQWTPITPSGWSEAFQFQDYIIYIMLQAGAKDFAQRHGIKF